MKRGAQLDLHASPTVVVARLGHLIAPVAALALALGITDLRGASIPLMLWTPVAGCVLLLLPLVVRGSRVGFALRYDGVEIDNLYRSTFIPWAGVDAFSWSHKRGRLLVRRLGGHPIAVDATAGLGGARRRDILVALKAAADQQSRDAAAHARPVVRHGQHSFAAYIA